MGSERHQGSSAAPAGAPHEVALKADTEAFCAGRARYRIRAVAQMTGVSTPTLRAWERRYGIPAPRRTSTAYRLYDETDVRMICRLRDLCAGGLAPAEAARLLLSEQQQSSSPSPVVGASQLAGETDVRRACTGACDLLLRHVVKLDQPALEACTRAALFLGSADEVFRFVIEPLMYEVGARCERGELDIAHEHLASLVITSAAADMLRLVAPTEDAPLALLACFPEEPHVLPLYGVALRLARQGIRSVVLGARTPTSSLALAIQSLQPAAVGLSTTIAPPANEAQRVIDEIAAACKNVPWSVGGQGIEGLAALIQQRGGHVLEGSSTAADAILRHSARLSGQHRNDPSSD